MLQRRKHARVDVYLPVSCTFHDHPEVKNVSSIGHAFDLSMGGMKVNMPLLPFSPRSKTVQYLLNLPQPFHKISGHATVKWMHKDTRKQSLTFGLEFSALDEMHREDIESIVHELTGENDE